ncbi:unnamed protein product, partial [Mesorhabditis belari]|uniref:DNA replication ATP-dependent helicase/nuclease n=1 Tax=Mesorhabditis belari TaxID=2138241 RepID=A0AAF3EX35_9BILA
MVIVSTASRYAIITGFVTSIDGSSVVLSSDHSLSTTEKNEHFDVDRLESMGTHAMSLASVASFMSDDVERTKLRRLVIDLDEPHFDKIPKSMVEKVSSLIKGLNKEQARAVVRSLVAKDYALIQGLPGAGKSTTLSCVIRCFLKLGQTVLVTSHTHSAVDNLFEKFMNDVPEEDLLRIGNMYAVKEKLAHLTIEAKLVKIKEDRFHAMKQILNSVKVVGATCLSVNSHPLFSFRRFDVCLVDEASLAVESSLLSALSVCSKFVLVGDAKQLAPLVQSREAKELGMGISLFEKLQKNTTALTSLNSQYRMNEKVAGFSSTLFYSGTLVCANESIAKECIKINSTEKPLSRIYSPELEHSVVFMDTHSESSPESQMSSQKGSSATYNNFEATQINQICNKFVRLGINPVDIGVVCTYRRQVDVIRDILDEKYVEVNTVDQFQGRDKSIIIWSLVWTNSDSRCELLHDERRVNVALTRAKHKLILVGCHSSMQLVSPIMCSLLKLIPSSDVVSIDSI